VERVAFEVVGVVQGVGFRPWAHRRATELGLVGWVANASGRVVGEVAGALGSVDAFVSTIHHGPPAAVVERVTVRRESVGSVTDGFEIREVTGARGADAGGWEAVAPDRVTCVACLAELADPADRRSGHPFVSCPACGPRATIVTAPPWARASTTMAGFERCGRCLAEHDDPLDRRHHHEAICCPDCGPRLVAHGPAGAVTTDPVAVAAEVLRGGGVVALKGLGGHQLLVDATDETAVGRLRAFKVRPDQPFAVMVADLDAATALARFDDRDAEVLAGPVGPVVVVPVRTDVALALSVGRGSRLVGLLLPTTPVHHLLVRAVGRPVVVTSGNRSGEPIVVDDDRALAWLGEGVDLALAHDRPIALAADDSVVRPLAGVPTLLRRARGHVPTALDLPVAVPDGRTVLAVGAQVKAVIGVARGHRALLSPHLGDLDDPSVLDRFEASVARAAEWVGAVPGVVVHDLHPGYRSTAFAETWAAEHGARLVGVQHHHAHAAACLAEHGESGPTLAVTFDGLGWGPDGTAWGGEVLEVDLVGFRRVASLESTVMPGGVAAVRAPWRMAAAWAVAAGLPDAGLDIARRHAEGWEAVADLARRGATAMSPATSSVGRLIDAVAALVGLDPAGSGRTTFEGQAAMALEQAADPSVSDAYPAPLRAVDDGWVMAGTDLVRGVVEDVAAGVAVGTIAARFHHGLVGMAAEAVEQAADRTGRRTVVLSGGCFQNDLLTTGLVAELERRGCRVLRHRRVPPNDGGLALGQLAVAAARLVAEG